MHVKVLVQFEISATDFSTSLFEIAPLIDLNVMGIIVYSARLAG